MFEAQLNEKKEEKDKKMYEDRKECTNPNIELDIHIFIP